MQYRRDLGSPIVIEIFAKSFYFIEKYFKPLSENGGSSLQSIGETSTQKYQQQNKEKALYSPL